MPRIEVFDVEYDVLKQAVVNTLERAKQQSEFWTDTMIAHVIDSQIYGLEQAMHSGDTILAQIYLNELQFSVANAESEGIRVDG